MGSTQMRSPRLREQNALQYMFLFLAQFSSSLWLNLTSSLLLFLLSEDVEMTPAFFPTDLLGKRKIKISVGDACEPMNGGDLGGSSWSDRGQQRLSFGSWTWDFPPVELEVLTGPVLLWERENHTYLFNPFHKQSTTIYSKRRPLYRWVLTILQALVPLQGLCNVFSRLSSFKTP